MNHLTLHTPKGRITSVKSALVALGAPIREVYLKHPVTRKIVPYSTAPARLRDEFSDGELLGWGEGLYKDGMVRHHPDRWMQGTAEWGRANAQCQRLGEAWAKLRKILT